MAKVREHDRLLSIALTHTSDRPPDTRGVVADQVLREAGERLCRKLKV
jgi:hypothetical protein